MPSTISGIVLDTADAPRSGVVVRFIPRSTPYLKASAPNTIITSVDITATTDALGAYSASLAPGKYTVIIANTDSFTVLVPAIDGSYTIDEVRQADLDLESFTGAPAPTDIASLKAAFTSTLAVEVDRKEDKYATRSTVCFYGEASYCNYTTTGNVVLSGLGNQANGTWTPGTLIDGDTIYANNQTNPAENGLYIAHAGAWTAVTDLTATQEVAAFIGSKFPDAIFALGNNNGSHGQAATIDLNVGQFYSQYMTPYNGSYSWTDPGTNKYWPVIGNLDYDNPNYTDTGKNLIPFEAYFDNVTPNPTDRYYKAVVGDVDYFVLNTDVNEPDGYTASSAQATWLASALAASTNKWKIVVLNLAPYASVTDYDTLDWSQWPFVQWGADAVIGANARIYERLFVTDSSVTIPYFVVGTGGRTLDLVGTPINTGAVVSQFRSATHGALVLESNRYSLKFSFYAADGTLLDSYEKISASVNKIYINPVLSPTGGLTVYPDGLGLASGQRGLTSVQTGAQMLALPSIPANDQIGIFILNRESDDYGLLYRFVYGDTTTLADGILAPDDDGGRFYAVIR